MALLRSLTKYNPGKINNLIGWTSDHSVLYYTFYTTPCNTLSPTSQLCYLADVTAASEMLYTVTALTCIGCM